MPNIKFPKVFKSTIGGQIVNFKSCETGIVLEPGDSGNVKGKLYDDFFTCSDADVWEPYEEQNPKIDLKEIYATY